MRFQGDRRLGTARTTIQQGSYKTLNWLTFIFPFWKPRDRHSPVEVHKLIDEVIQKLREDGVTTFGTTGYCFGGRYSLHLAIEGVAKVAVLSHPTMVDIPGDFEVRFLLIVSASDDAILTLPVAFT
jgi:hypothetical protein